MREVYLNPTVAKLAERLGQGADEGVVTAKREPFHVPSDFAYYGCGALQLLFYAVCSLLGVAFFDAGLEWTYAAVGDPLKVYLRSVAFGVGSFVVLTAVPIAAKWVLIGRWKAESIPIWSLRYFRFWVVKTLTHSAPVVVFSGSPIYNIYLRLLGARIGPQRRHRLSGCPSLHRPYRHRRQTRSSARIRSCWATGPNPISFIPDRSRSAAMHSSAKPACWTSARPWATTRSSDMPRPCRAVSASRTASVITAPPRRRRGPTIARSRTYPVPALRRGSVRGDPVLGLFAIAIPIPILLLAHWEHYSAGFAGGASANADALTSGMLLLSVGSFFGSLAAGLLAVYVVPRVCQVFLETDKTYSLYGFHYSIAKHRRARQQFALLQSAVRRQLRRSSTTCGFVGWNLNKVEQTGSNFGTNQQHDNPFLCDIGSGTMVSDGLSMINMHQSSSSFRLGQDPDRRSQLPRQQHPLSAGWPHRRELSPRHQGDDPDRRAGARERRAAGIALFRDSAHRRPRQDPHERLERGNPPAAPAAEESATISSPPRCSCSASGCSSSPRWSSAAWPC